MLTQTNQSKSNPKPIKIQPIGIQNSTYLNPKDKNQSMPHCKTHTQTYQTYSGDEIDHQKKPSNPSMPHCHIQPLSPLDQRRHHCTTKHKTQQPIAPQTTHTPQPTTGPTLEKSYPIISKFEQPIIGGEVECLHQRTTPSKPPDSRRH